MLRHPPRRLVLLALAVLAACARPETSDPSAGAVRIDRVLAGLRPGFRIAGEPDYRWTLVERMRHYGVPAVSIAVIDSGRIAWSRAVGVKEAGGSDSVNTETVFQAGSISKPTFAVGAMRLVQDGTLALDRDVNLDLTSWKVPENRFTAREKVTLRRLLSHSAGLTIHGFPGYPLGAPVPSVIQVLDGEAPANTAPVRVDTFPGAIVRYSGGGTTVAMLLATDLTRRPFPALMRETVFDPIGMARSTYEQPLPAAFVPNAASGHSGTGEVLNGRYHTYPEMSAAGLWTTPRDLAALAIELQKSYAGSSSKVLTQATVRQMFTVQPPGSGESFGIGYHVSGTGSDLEYSHGGANEGFRADFVAFAERGQGAVVMTNGDRGDQLIGELLAAIAAEYRWPSHHPETRTVVATDPKALAELAGNYALEVGRPETFPALVSVEGGRLFLEVGIGGIGKVELLADSDSTFFMRETAIPVAFELNRAGEAAAIVIDGSVRGKKREQLSPDRPVVR